MCRHKLNLLWCIVICNVYFVNCFNIETFNYAVFQAPSRQSMFGFTVAVHKEGHNPWVLVGAPEQQSLYQQDVERGGAVFKCRSDSDNVCEEIPFDRTGNRIMGQHQIDNKTMQWFGATLSASGTQSGPIVACAPRYVWFTKDLNRRDPVGTCYVSDGYFSNFEEYSPCRTIHWGYHRQGSCQAGFSAAINAEGDRLYVGAPGSYYWQGQMYSIDAHARFNFTPGVYQETYGAKGSVYQQSLETRPAVFSTNEGQANDDDSYMGYSTIVGDFQDNGEQGIVVGMPRGAELHGRILFFTWNLTNYKNISSNKIGSYFGYALAAADVDGDKKLDLIVGAPMHTEPNNEGKYDVGRVYIFYHASDRFGTFNSADTLDGINSKSRFGLSLSTLGDLNQDGYDDFAVGAPYDGPNGRGAVYIYYGSSDGVLKKYGQVIFAEELQSAHPITTFGFSVTGGMDMDGNEYPDMAVGAYLSDTAFFFRSRPVVRVEAFVKFLTPNNQIDIKKKNCTLSNGQQGTCTSIDFCVKYSGKGIPEYIYLNLQYILDSKKIGPPRMSFVDYDTHTYNDTMVLQKDTPQLCKTKQVYVKSDIRDKLTPLEAEVKYFMSEDSRYAAREIRDPRSRLQPILDLNSPPSKKDSISIQKNCGPDNICIPDLHVNVTSNVQKYLLGSNTNLEFDVIVSNHGEDAFETTFELKYPEGIYYKKIENKPNHNILCSPLENRTIQCQIGNPLPAAKIASFRILFQPFHKEGMAPSYEFDMYVNSTNPENQYSLGDNHKHISIDIWIDSTLDLSGVSYPREVQYNASRYTATEIKRESDIGPQVIHVYNLRNKGPATIQEAEIFILWPYRTLGDVDFLYLLDQPATIGDVKCEAVPANYRNYELDYHSKSIWDRLEIDTNANEFTNSEFHSGTISKGHSSSQGGSTGTHTDVTIEQGSGIRGTVGGTQSKSQGRLDAEIGSSGDASTVHKRRQNVTYTYVSKPGVQHYTEKIEAHWNKSIINGVPYITYTNVTTIRDAQGNIVNQFQRTNTIEDYDNIRVSHDKNYRPNIIYTSSGGNTDQGSKPLYTVSGVHQDNAAHTQKGQGGQFSQSSHEESYFSQSGQRQDGRGRQDANQRFGSGQHSSGGQQTSFQQRGGSSSSHSTGGQQSNVQQHGGSSSTQSGGGQFRYEGSTGQQGGPNTDGSYEEHRESSYDFRSGSQNQGGGRVSTGSHVGGVYDSGARVGESSERGGHTRYETSRHQGGHSQYGHQESGGSQYESSRRQGGGHGYQESGSRRQETTEERQGSRQGYDGSGNRQGGYTITGSHEIGGGQAQASQGSQRAGSSYENSYQRGGSSQGGYRGSGDGEYSSHHQVSYEGKTIQDNVIQGGQHGSGQSSGRSRGGYIDANGVYHSLSSSSQNESSSESRGRGSQVIGDFVVNSGDGFGEQAALGHGFTFNTLNVGGIQSQTEAAGANQGGNANFKQTWHTEETIERSGQIPPTYFNTIERDNVPTDKPNLNNLHRGRRQVSSIENLIQCNSTKCLYIKCTVGTLEKEKEVSIALRSRINMRVIREVSSQAMKFSSMMVGRISKLPYIGTPREQPLHSHEIFTEVPAQESEIKPHVIPLWVVVLSAVGGTLALLLIIYILYKCGFFKRNRPPTAPERQPLNRNGYHHGDEAL